MPDLSYLGKLIYEARSKAGITSSKLCYGLCSISMLSRIESGERTPGFLLFTALYQRAGGSVSDIVYLCSKRDAKLFSIIKESFNFSGSAREKYQKLLNEYSEIADLSNNLEAQYYYFFKAQCEPDSDKCHEYIMKALDCTLPKVKLEDVSSYCLSSIERNIITRSLHHYIYTKNTRVAAKVYEDLAYMQERNSSDTKAIINAFRHRYGLLLCYLVDGDIDEVLHIAKRFFKKYDSETYPDLELVVAQYLYQLGYSTLYTGDSDSGIDIITSYYMNRLVGNPRKAEAVREDAQKDLGYEFEIEFV